MPVLDRRLADFVPEVSAAVRAEPVRRQSTLVMIAGENFAPVGGPLEHVIAATAVAFKMASEPVFRERQERALAGARLLAERLSAPDVAGAAVSVLSGGADVHLVLVDLRESELDGQQAEDRLHHIGITVNRNAVPFDPGPPMVTSGAADRFAGPGRPRLRGGRRHHCGGPGAGVRRGRRRRAAGSSGHARPRTPLVPGDVR